MPLDRYMALCLGDREHGYYMTRDPFGPAGDFTTAPEISQMFGELIGLWAVDCWAKLGAPSPFHLIELGPGRGTLMADAMRAARLRPGFVAAARIELVETSAVLRERQRTTLAGLDPAPRWHDELAALPQGPSIVIANEFFDALPIAQFERVAGEWRERVVVLDAGGRLAIGHAGPAPDLVRRRLGEAPDGAVCERSAAREDAAAALARRLAADQGAALIIDYGHARAGLGDTLQAVRGHRPVGVLAAPGQSDLTAHVDFAALARAACAAGAARYGPMEMGAFLTALGIAERAARLKAGRDAQVAGQVDAAVRRLTEAAGMGTLFKVLALAGPGRPAPAPFERKASRP